MKRYYKTTTLKMSTFPQIVLTDYNHLMSVSISLLKIS